MTTLEGLHERLVVIATMLDACAADVRDIPVTPITANIEHIGSALMEIFNVMRAIHNVRPDLRFDSHEESSPYDAANRRLTDVLVRALRCAERGDHVSAANLLSTYADSEPSLMHKNIAVHEADRLTRKAR